MKKIKDLIESPFSFDEFLSGKVKARMVALKEFSSNSEKVWGNHKIIWEEDYCINAVIMRKSTIAVFYFKGEGHENI